MLVHYIIVRRDLPLGVLAAMITHAAGESAAAYQASQGSFDGAIAVVLEAKNEPHLNEVHEYLKSRTIAHVSVHESNGTYSGQYMAIGVVPGEREELSENFRFFQCLKRLDEGMAGENDF